MIKKLTGTISKLLRGANHDFCPNANKYVYWLKQPIGWVVSGAFFSLLVGILVGPQGFVLMWAFIALLILGVAWPLVSMRGLECKLRFDENHSVENEELNAILEVTNRLPLPVFGLMLTGQFLQDDDSLGESEPVAVGLRRVSAWSVCRFDWKLKPCRRGQLPPEFPRISTGFPFGLYRVEKPVNVSGKTIVWPSSCELLGIPALTGTLFNVDGSASQKPGHDGETIGVREYRHGDSIRNIHWNHTARCTRLIVREKQSLTQTPIRIVLDLTRSRHSGLRNQSTYEWAIRVAAAVCQQFHRHHASIKLVCIGLPKECESQISNRRGISEVLDFLALLPPMPTQSVEANGSNGHAEFFANNHFTVLIHTKSFPHVPENENLKSICIDQDGFPVDEYQEEEFTTEAQKEYADKNFGLITSPEFAVGQLQEIWAGEFNASL